MKEKRRPDWAAVGRSVLLALALYTALQFAGAAMVWGEWVTEEKMPLLAGAFAAASVLLGQAVCLRKSKQGRLVLCLLSGAGFAAVPVLVGMIFGESGGVGNIGALLVPVLAASVGAAALKGGKKRGKGKRRGYIK